MPIITPLAAVALRNFGFLASTGFKDDLTPGQSYGGGFYGGKISTNQNGIATHNLVVAPKSSGQSNSVKWATSYGTTTATSVIDGATNSNTLNSATYPAAKFCNDLVVGGYSDWYLPATKELDVCYFKLKPTTASNTSYNDSGINSYAVPKRSTAYSSSVPAQTSATDFQSGGAEAFDASQYWSSTQAGSMHAEYIKFSDGLNYAIYKDNNYKARAIRKVAI